MGQRKGFFGAAIAKPARASEIKKEVNIIEKENKGGGLEMKENQV
jgi:hypothetical protein